MRPLKIGITGGIGSGKSTVCRIFRILGIPVFDADKEAKRIMMTDEALVRAIREEFGDEAYREDGSLNRAYMAATVFGDEQRLQKLNALVHPAVIRAAATWSDAQNAPYTVKEAALMFESGSYKSNDYNILVTSPVDMRIRRVMQRDQVPEEAVRTRISRQWPEEEKARLADFTLINDDRHAILPQVLELDQLFRSQHLQ